MINLLKKYKEDDKGYKSGDDNNDENISCLCSHVSPFWRKIQHLGFVGVNSTTEGKFQGNFYL